MYYYDSALSLAKEANPRWSDTDLRLLDMTTLFTKYISAYIRVYRFGSGGVKNYRLLKLEDLRSDDIRITYSLTLEDFLASYPASLNLPGTPNAPLPTVTNKTILFSDAIRAGFHPRRVVASGHPDTEAPLGFKTDLLLTRYNTNYDTFDNNCVFMVNGILHNSYVQPGFGIRVLAGGISVDKYEDTQLGVISFRALGGLTKIAIEDDMLNTLDDNQALRKGVVINLGTSLVGKSLLLSLGGFLYVNEEAFRVINPEEGIVRVDLEKIEIPHRLFEAQERIGLDALQLTQHTGGVGTIGMDEFWSDDVLRRYFTMSQSFAMVVNSPSIYRDHKKVEHGMFPGVLIANQEPIYPVQLDSGVFAEYWVRREREVYVMNVASTEVPNYQYRTGDWINMDLISPALLAYAPYVKANAQFLIIGSETVA